MAISLYNPNPYSGAAPAAAAAAPAAAGVPLRVALKQGWHLALEGKTTLAAIQRFVSVTPIQQEGLSSEKQVFQVCKGSEVLFVTESGLDAVLPLVVQIDPNRVRRIVTSDELIADKLSRQFGYNLEQQNKQIDNRLFRYLDAPPPFNIGCVDASSFDEDIEVPPSLAGGVDIEAPPSLDVYSEAVPSLSLGIQDSPSFNADCHVENGNGFELGVCHFQGKRRSQEDTHLVTSFRLQADDRVYPVEVFAIFDGHGGIQAAEFVRENLKGYLQETLSLFCEKELTDKNIWNALKLTMVRLHERFSEPKPGTTVAMAMVLDGKLWTANVGDSRIVLDNGIQLTEDAKPEDPRYEKGIKKRGGYVSNKRLNGRLAMARAIGDHYLDPFIIPRPKITVYPLDTISDGCQLILACDGVFDVASSSQVASAARENKDKSLKELARGIVYSASEAGSTDNISAIIVRFDRRLSKGDIPLGGSQQSEMPRRRLAIEGVTPEERLSKVVNSVLEVEKALKGQFGCAQEQASLEQPKGTQLVKAPAGQFLLTSFDQIESSKSSCWKRESIGYEFSGCNIIDSGSIPKDHYMVDSFNLRGKDRSYLGTVFGLFNGHGNDIASGYLKENLKGKIETSLSKFCQNELTDPHIWNGLKLAFVELNEELGNQESGAVAVVGILLNEKLWVANVGNSRAFLNNGISLSQDADPEVPYYKQGIESRYGSVVDGKLVDSQLKEPLEVARAIGYSHAKAVNPRPKITTYCVSEAPYGTRLILGSNSLFKVYSTEELVGIFKSFQNGKLLLGETHEVLQDVVHTAFSKNQENHSLMVIRL